METIISVNKVTDKMYNVYFEQSGVIVVDQCIDDGEPRRFRYSEIMTLLKTDPKLLDKPLPEKEKTQDEINTEARTELQKLDNNSIRSIRAVIANTATEDDKNRLAEIEKEAIETRKKIK
jgi:hypothetical protein